MKVMNVTTKLATTSSVKIRFISFSLKFKFWSKCFIGFNIANSCFISWTVDRVAILFVGADNCCFDDSGAVNFYLFLCFYWIVFNKSGCFPLFFKLLTNLFIYFPLFP